MKGILSVTLEFLTINADECGSTVSAQKLLVCARYHTGHTKLKAPQPAADLRCTADYLVEFEPGQLNVCDYTSGLLAKACESKLEAVLTKLLQKQLYLSQ